jgi:hypothetical protein
VSSTLVRWRATLAEHEMECGPPTHRSPDRQAEEEAHQHGEEPVPVKARLAGWISAPRCEPYEQGTRYQSDPATQGDPEQGEQDSPEWWPFHS